MASSLRDNQRHWRLVLAGKGPSHTGAVQWVEMERAERTDAVADEPQPRPLASINLSVRGAFLRRPEKIVRCQHMKAGQNGGHGKMVTLRRRRLRLGIEREFFSRRLQIQET